MFSQASVNLFTGGYGISTPRSLPGHWSHVPSKGGGGVGENISAVSTRLVTRKNSSRMRTAHLPTVFCGIPGSMSQRAVGTHQTPGHTHPPMDIPAHPHHLPAHPHHLPAHPHHIPTPRHLWKHYLPATSFAGGKNK